MLDFIQKFKFMEVKPEAILKQEIHHTKKYWFFISYFAEGDECFPMEIRP